MSQRHKLKRHKFDPSRSHTDGRSAIVDASDGQDVFDASWDARTQVHEYGGAASTVYGDVIYFSHMQDRRVYKTTKGGTPTPITPGLDELQAYSSSTG